MHYNTRNCVIVNHRAPFLTNARETELKQRVRRYTENILSCDEYRIFWLEFGNTDSSGSIVIGQGWSETLVPIGSVQVNCFYAF